MMQIARVLQHRLALASYKTKHGLEKLDLDTIEPRVEEDLKRKRSSASPNSEPPGHFGEVDLEWLRDNGGRSSSSSSSSSASSSSSMSEHGPSRDTSPRKRPRTSSSDPQLPPQSRRPATSWMNSPPRRLRSSPGYLTREHSPPGFGYPQPMMESFTTDQDSHSSPPLTPPGEMTEPSYSMSMTGGEDSDLFIYLSASQSPTSLNPTKAPFTPSTPPSKHAVLPSSMMSPGPPQTPQTSVFNFADFVNITPSPAQAAFPSGTIRTPSIHARKLLNFDNIVPPSGSPGLGGAMMSAISFLEIGGELVN